MSLVSNFIEKIIRKLTVIIFYNFSAYFVLSALKRKISTFTNGKYAVLILLVCVGSTFLFGGLAKVPAFCKYLCPITVLLKPMSYFSLLRVHCDESKCVRCGKCLRVCPMNVEVNKESRKRKNGTECILCYECTKVCPTKALH